MIWQRHRSFCQVKSRNYKSDIEQRYTEGLAALEILKCIILLTGFSDIYSENGSFLGFQVIFVLGKSNVSVNSVKCRKNTFGLFGVIQL